MVHKIVVLLYRALALSRSAMLCFVLLRYAKAGACKGKKGEWSKDVGRLGTEATVGAR